MSMPSKIVETQYFLPVIACNAFYHCLTTIIHFPFLYSSEGKQQFLWRTETIHSENTVYDSEYLIERLKLSQLSSPSTIGDKKKVPFWRSEQMSHVHFKTSILKFCSEKKG